MKEMPINTPKESIEAIRKDLLFELLKRPYYEGATPVFGTGPVPCRVMVIGEAPGREETRELTPFVGRAGRFFVEILEDALGLGRSEVYMTNVVKVWPTVKTKRLRTRPPTKEEQAFFLPFLLREILIVGPEVIVAVGKTGFSSLCPDAEFSPGAWAECRSLPVMPVYHPAYILRKQKAFNEGTEGLKEALGKVRRRLLSHKA